MLKEINSFIKKENITFRNLFNPIFILKLLHKHNYLVFFTIGVIGVIINLTAVFILTEYVFGLERYYTAYLIGLTLNIIFNFIFHTWITFQAKNRHIKRFILFVVYSIALTLIQALTVNIVTPLVGLKYYLLVISGFIFTFSTLTFIFFKLYLFKD
jgi:putative flippase GtrA